jgi:NAD(P)-dependent dehydrogenase (short-subunit alcohol dehydrogenase family)
MKTALITGATSGIGKATAFELARAKLNLVLLARNAEQGKQVVAEIKEKTQNPNIELLIADLSSQAEIRNAAKQFLQAHSKLHILINNAGVAVRHRTLSPDGIEMTFAVNHLAYFLLTQLLLPALESAAPSRIINVASEAHRTVQFDAGNLQAEKRFTGFRAYAVTKLCNVLFTYELARRLKGTGITANVLHPGFLHTQIFREAGAWLRFFVRITAKKPEAGARAIVRLALDPELENVSGKYFKELRMAESSESSRDEQAAQKLWEISEQHTHPKK